jgi:hypothetical protein
VVNSPQDLAAPPPGVVTLRSALLAANADPNPDTITFDTSLAGQTINLSLTGDATAGPSALPVGGIGQPSAVTIDGGAAPGLTLSGPGGATNLRLFFVAPGSSLTLEDLTLSNGQARGGDGAGGASGGGGAAGMGGAVFNEGGALTAQACTFTANQANGGAGGAGSSAQNVAPGGGGGGLGGPGSGAGGPPNGGLGGYDARNHGLGDPGGFGGGSGAGLAGSRDLSVSNGSGGAGGFGGGRGGAGGYYGAAFVGGLGGFGGGAGGDPGHGGGGGSGLGGAIFSDGGSLTLLDSTFAGNAVRGGIGGANASGGSAASGVGQGGAVCSHNSAVLVSSCTFVGNIADQAALYLVADIWASGAAVDNTALAATAGGSDLQAAVINRGALSLTGFGDLVQSPGAGLAGLTAPLTGLSPLLGPLQDNGGPTRTSAPLPGSPLIDAGVTAVLPAGLSADQRGQPRVLGGAVDIGAVESAFAAGAANVKALDRVFAGLTS